MNTKLYTNTGKVGSIAGLIVTTVALNYVAQNSTKIVDGTITVIKNGLRSGKRFINNRMTREVEVWSTLPNGQVYNTGMKTRVRK